MNKKNIDRCVNLIGETFDLELDDSESTLDDIIETVINKYGSKLSLTDEEKQRIIDFSKYTFLSKQDDGQMLKKEYSHTEWYTELCNEGTADNTFWFRYRDYIKDEIGITSTNKLDFNTLKDLMNEIGDPRSQSDFYRRGLIIGDVQSGKTSTYIGLICKAADAGYKVIILLTGVTENLRVQTQERVEEGFVGFTSSDDESNSKRIGVGKDGKPLLVTTMTSRDDDFVGKKDKILTSIENNRVVLCVVKKNTIVLSKLIKWLKDTNLDEKIGKVTYPMLLIDDEADNASINTNIPEENPTAVNNGIRELLDLFNHKTYVGFTATPYANIFIDPDVPDELFPEDFIYVLGAPDKYIGAEKIFYKEGEYYSSINIVKDAGMNEKDGFSFYTRHKKEWKGKLPNSLTDAIYAYVLANAIRDIRGDVDDPRGMIINISRFKNVHKYIKTCVEEIYNKLYSRIKYDMSDDEDEIELIPELKRLHDIWIEQYGELGYLWTDISGQLLDSCEKIQIMVINSSKESDKLDYNKNPDLRVIAIGGLTLSRGITIKGLMISYFFRNTATYDVLMQMGRWFGYRFGYEDLFRIWIGKKSVDWYAEISEATNLLKKDIAKMRELKKTPREFQLRVRNDSAELKITARNKMRSAADSVELVSFYGSFLETHYLLSDYEKNRKNWNAVLNLLNSEKQKGNSLVKDVSDRSCWFIHNLSRKQVCDFIDSFSVSSSNEKLDMHAIHKFIEESDSEILNSWQLGIVGGEKSSPIIEGLDCCIHAVKRTCRVDEADYDRIIVGGKGKMTSAIVGTYGLNLNDDGVKDQMDKAKQNYADAYYKNKQIKLDIENKKIEDFPASIWYEYIDNRIPTILIYYIRAVADEGGLDISEKTFKDNPLGWIGIAIGIPRCGGKKESHKYKVTKVVTSEYDEDEGNEE